tara:strand:- start:430 stop:672 length:243 start_codon:yes stop_codon:yes gene_type:complete
MKRKKNSKNFIFQKENYKIMILGLLFISIGFLLMSGGASDDPNIFNEEIYNFRRIRLAPTLVLIGFGIEVFAILYKPKKK